MTALPDTQRALLWSTQTPQSLAVLWTTIGKINNFAEWCTENNLGWIRYTGLASWDSTAQRIYHDHQTSPPWLKKHRKGSIFQGNSRRINFRAKIWSASTEEQQKAAWLETSQSGMVCARPRTGRLCSWWLKLPRTSLVPIYRSSVISV